jgi:hypothetical protein
MSTCRNPTDEHDEFVIPDLKVEIGNDGEAAKALDEIADRDRSHDRPNQTPIQA